MSVDNLHRPSTLDPTPNGTSPEETDMSARAQLARLAQLKGSLQARLDVCFAVLQTVSWAIPLGLEQEAKTLIAYVQNNANMLTSLVDPEGFPRGDMDVAGVRTARAEVHRLRNDLTDVTNKMAVLLEEALARGDEPEAGAGVNGMEVEEEAIEAKPFAKVDGVFPGGPADQAVSNLLDRLVDRPRADGGLGVHMQGLKRDDLLLSMGSVSSSTPQTLTAIATLVQTSQNVPLPLSILRSPSTVPLSLTLTPRANWGGRGLLGMHIVPT